MSRFVALYQEVRRSTSATLLPPSALTQIGILIAFNLVVVATTIWLVAWRNYYSIRARGLSLILAQSAFGITANTMVNLYFILFGPFPCIWIFIGQTMGAVLGIVVVAARVIRLMKMYKFHQSAIEGYTRFYESKIGAGEETARRDREIRAMYSGVGQFLEARYCIARSANRKAWIFVGCCAVVVVAYTVVAIVVDGRLIGPDLFAPLDFGVTSSSPGLTRRGFDCPLDFWIFWPGYVIIIFSCVFGIPICLYFIRSLRDTHSIRLDLATHLILAAPSLAFFVVDALVMKKYAEQSGPASWIHPGLATYVIYGVNHFTAVVLPIMRNAIYTRRQKQLAMNMGSLRRVIEDPALFSALKTFAVRDLCSEQVIFLEELRILKAKVAVIKNKDASAYVPFTDPTLSALTTVTSTTESSFSSPLDYYATIATLDPQIQARRAPVQRKPLPPPTNANPDTITQIRLADKLYRQINRRLQNSNSEASLRSPIQSPPQSFKHLSILSEGNVGETVPVELLSHFKTLCDVFVRWTAPMELNLSYMTRKACIDAIDSQTFAVDVFDSTRDEVVQSLFENSYPRFIASIRDRNGSSQIGTRDHGLIAVV
ncbi:hypothetical protein BJ742DRAFT_845673 [Cladochytrium replicatum]|nr:hypothetical protein BJ742DRAFT_845673 [Cladochytrium replicatum]